MASYYCIECTLLVRPRQEAVQCDGCSLWQHRTCGTGIDRDTYRAAVQEGSIEWLCAKCTVQDESMELADAQPLDEVPEAESTVTKPDMEDLSASFGSSICDPTINDITMTDVPLTYEIIKKSTKRQRELLVDGFGYRFSVKRRLKTTVHWQCTVRPKINPCGAKIIQRGDNCFVPSVQSHNHGADPGAALAAKVTKKIKTLAVKDVFKPASAIVDEVFLEDICAAPCRSLPKPDHMARTANRLRQKLRPTDPEDLAFTLEMEHIPTDFFQADVRVRERRHLIFATNQQLKVLSKAKTWYIGGTFKLCRYPFTQLVTVNAFVRKEECLKQVPLVFVLMSGKKKKDYKKVIQKILDILPSEPRVRQVTLDFERAVWSVLRELLPQVKLMGCAFHWSQALWRKVQACGLQVAYKADNGTYHFIGKLMALPYLPDHEIPRQFRRLRDEATPALQQLVEYVEDTWIDSNVWPPSTWSVFKQSVRTNNDLKGWHNALNRRASGQARQLSFYQMINLLHREAKLAALQMRLVSEKKLTKIQKKKYRNLQGKLFDLWENYSEDSNARRLLRACSHICAGTRTG